MKYPIRYYLYGNCIMKLKFSKKNNKMISKNFLKSFVIYRHLIDISCFITLYKQFEIVKKIITNKINNKDEYEENNEIIFIDKHKNKKI